MAEPNKLEAWREVHSTLLKACEMAQDSVDHLKMEERYWLEELSSNLTVDGTLSGTSVWNQPRKPNMVKRAPSSKRKRASKKSDSPNKSPAAKKLKIGVKKMKKSPTPAQQQLSKRKLPKKKQIIALAATADSDDETGFNEDNSSKHPAADDDDNDDLDDDASSTDAAASIVSMGTGVREDEDDDDVVESFAVETISEPFAASSSSRNASSPHPSQADNTNEDDEEDDSDLDDTMVCMKERNKRFPLLIDIVALFASFSQSCIDCLFVLACCCRLRLPKIPWLKLHSPSTRPLLRPLLTELPVGVFMGRCKMSWTMKMKTMKMIILFEGML